MTFDNIDIEKCKFHCSKHPVDIKNVKINKVMTFNGVSFGKRDFKYFIDFKDNEKVKPLCIMLPK